MMMMMQGRVVDVPNKSNDASSGIRQVPLGPVLYLERSDFREVSAGFDTSTNTDLPLARVFCEYALHIIVVSPLWIK